jgi:hypothetical protein
MACVVKGDGIHHLFNDVVDPLWILGELDRLY